MRTYYNGNGRKPNADLKAKLLIISLAVVLGISLIYKNGPINIENGLVYLKSTLPFSIFGKENQYDEHEATYAVTPDEAIENQIVDDENDGAQFETDFIATMENIDRIKTFADIKKYLYTIDDTAYADENLLDIKKLLETDIKTNLSKEPKILIFHTHSQEDFIDSKEGSVDDTIVGVGSVLADILAKDYGIGVVHDLGEYDVVDGKTERGYSYERMEPSVLAVLEQFPTIEVVIDLHRDGVGENVRLVTEINGEPAAKIMFFNGILCENNGGGGNPVVNLPNPYLSENLSFSLKMQLTANELYPDFTRKLYLKPYRYSLHMAPKSLLIEAGANTNTVQEVKNAMRPLAEILVKTLSGRVENSIN